MRNEAINRTYAGVDRDALLRSRIAARRARRAVRWTQQGAGWLWAALRRSGDDWIADDAPPGVKIANVSFSARDCRLQAGFAIAYYLLLAAIVIWAFLRQ